MTTSAVSSSDPRVGFREMVRLIHLLLAGSLRSYYFWIVVLSGVYFSALIPPFLLGRVIDFLGGYHSGQSLVPMYRLIGMISLVVILAAIVRLQAKDKLFQLCIRASYQARVLGFDRLMDQSVSWHQAESTGNKVQRISTGSTALENFLRLIVGELLTITIHSFGAIGSFFLLHWSYGVIGAAYLSIFLMIHLLFFLKVKTLVAQSKYAGENATGVYVEGAGNILTIKALHVEQNIIKRVVSKEQVARDMKLQHNSLVIWKWRCFQLLTGLCMGGFVLTVSLDVVHGLTSAGSLAMLFAYFRTLQEAAGDSSGLFDAMSDHWISVSRMAPIFFAESSEPRGAGAFPSDWRTIDLVAVRAQYGDDVGGLSHFSSSVKRGEHIGIVGWSGAGKSTLSKVLLGILPPQEGQYQIGGVPFSAIARDELAANMSMVLQDCELFNMTLLENITLMREVSPERLAQAVRIAQLESVVQKLPEGLETIIGERGYRLSGGERQRLGIARAICKNPEILVLDEATSALDSETESGIHSALVQELGEKTFIIIAHRLSTLKDVDRILVLENGRVVEEGTPAELSQNESSRFSIMWRMQQDTVVG